MKRQIELGIKPIPQLLWKFAYPSVVAMIFSALYNIIDRIFVGNGVGSLGIGGVTVVFPLALLSMAFGMLVGVGASALVSIRLGEQRHEAAEKILNQAFLLNAVLSLSLTVIGLLFLEPMLYLFGATPDVFPYAYDYAVVILWGNIFAGIGFGMNNLIRAEGSPRIAMMTIFIAGILHVILDYIFIFQLHMGIQGAAWSTILSQAVTSFWVLYYFTLGRRSSIHLRLSAMRLDATVVLPVLKIGLAPFLLQLSQVMVTTLVNHTIRFYAGSEAALYLVAFGVMYSVSSLFFMPMIGIAQGAQPIIGYNYGALQYDRVRRTATLAIIAGTVFGILCYAIIFLFPYQVVALFNAEDARLIEVGGHLLRLANLMMPGVAFGIIGSQFFQSINKPAHSIFLSMSRLVLFLMPSLVILPHFFGVEGIAYAYIVSDVASILITLLFFQREFKKPHYHLPQPVVPLPDLP